MILQPHSNVRPILNDENVGLFESNSFTFHIIGRCTLQCRCVTRRRASVGFLGLP